MNTQQFEELLLQSLEHELGGIEIYSAALRCAVHADLKEEWQRYLDETKSHVRALEQIAAALGVATARETPGRKVVREVGQALVRAIDMARAAGEAEQAQIVACEAVVLAETKDHANWQLLGKCADDLPGDAAETLLAAYRLVEDQEDEHLYHSKGWCRELWVQSLGLPSVLPPPEEQQDVKTAIGAARAEQAAERARVKREASSG